VRVPACGAVAFHDGSTPTNVYLAFPGTDYQIEVFDPSEAQAKALVRSGKIEPVQTGQGEPALASKARLKAVAATLGHPRYRAGPMSGTAHELRQTTGDRIHAGYLPSGTAAAAEVPVTGGGIAFSNRSSSASVYVACPGSIVEIEVYDPSPTRAAKLVASGRLVQLG
jgi:hypothetical protein